MARNAVAICTPMPFEPGTKRLERIRVEWHRARMSIALPTCFNFREIAADGMEVGEARNFAVRKLLEEETPCQFLFWLDYDVLPMFDCLTKLFYRAQCYPDYDIFAGVYCCKGSPPEPLIYMDQGAGPFWNWAVGDLLFDVNGVHSGLTLVRSSLYRKMLKAEPDVPLYKTTGERFIKDGVLCTSTGTEDLFFCRRAVDDYGAKILVDTSVLAGHVDNRTGQMYGLPDDSPPIQRSHFMRKHTRRGILDAEERFCDCTLTKGCEDRKGYHRVRPFDDDEQVLVESACPICDGTGRRPKLKALDIGAGNTRRHWPGHKTYTTDLRPETKPDYVMDTRLLNLPDEDFDLVASNHHLEHIGRWDQPKVWQEMVRILKSGGRMEHIVPSLEWAAAHIGNGEVDESVYNVLYGAQEVQGYERGMNTHFFGYTKRVAEELATVSGLVDVEVRDWRDDEMLGLNLVITGRKPDTTDSS